METIGAFGILLTSVDMIDRISNLLSLLTNNRGNGGEAAFKLRVAYSTDNGCPAPAEAIKVSNPAPVFSEWATGIVEGSLRTSPDGRQILGDVFIRGRIISHACGTITNSVKFLGPVRVCLNGTVDEVVSITPTREDVLSNGLPTDPHSISARFSSVFRGLSLSPGWNRFDAFATNAFGLSGCAYHSFQVVVSIPENEYPKNFSGCGLKTGEVSEFEGSGSGDFHPFLLKVERSASSPQDVTMVHINKEPYALVRYHDGLYLARPWSATPTLFAAVAAPLFASDKRLRALPRGVRNGSFEDGFTAGLLGSLVTMFDGVVPLGKLPAHLIEPCMPLKVKFRSNSLTGPEQSTKIEQHIPVSWTALDTLMQIAHRIRAQDHEVIMDVLTGNVAELNRLGANFQLALEYAAEIIQTFSGEPMDYDHGRIMGAMINQMLRRIAINGPACSLKSTTALEVIAWMRGHRGNQ